MKTSIEAEEIEYAKTFRPTQAEFKDFKKYIYKISSNPKYANLGCFKVG